MTGPLLWAVVGASIFLGRISLQIGLSDHEAVEERQHDARKMHEGLEASVAIVLAAISTMVGRSREYNWGVSEIRLRQKLSRNKYCYGR